MSFTLGLILGAIASYLIVSYITEVKIRINYLEDLLGFDKQRASKWLDTKNPGIGLKKPSQLSLKEFIKFVGTLS